MVGAGRARGWASAACWQTAIDVEEKCGLLPRKHARTQTQTCSSPLFNMCPTHPTYAPHPFLPSPAQLLQALLVHRLLVPHHKDLKRDRAQLAILNKALRLRAGRQARQAGGREARYDRWVGCVCVELLFLRVTP